MRSKAALDDALSHREAPVDQRHVEFAQRDLRGVGVGPEVELRGRGLVAQRVHRAAHHDDIVQQVAQGRFPPERQRDVRQRAETGETYLAGRGPGGVDDGVDSVFVGRRDGGVRAQGTAQSPLAVDVGGVVEVLHERSARSLVDRYGLGSPGEVERVLGVLDLGLELDVAGDDRQRLDGDRLRAEGHEDGLGVVDGGVRIDDELLRHDSDSVG